MTQGADEEAACRGGVPLLGQQHLDDLPELVDRPVQVPPPTGGLDVGLIDKPPVPGRMPKWPGIGEQREPLHQPVHRDVVDLDAELGQQLLDVPVGQPIGRYQRTATVITSGGKPEPGKRRPVDVGTGEPRSTHLPSFLSQTDRPPAGLDLCNRPATPRRSLHRTRPCLVSDAATPPEPARAGRTQHRRLSRRTDKESR
jgi:hypothetical protein